MNTRAQNASHRLPVLALLIGALAAAPATAPTAYHEDFEQSEIGKLPPHVLVLNGEVAVRDDTRTTVPLTWTPATWTHLKLRVTKVNDKQWRIEGKAWPDPQPEPDHWTIAFDDTEEPPAGRASVWAEPFSGKPLRFDDLAAT